MFTTTTLKHWEPPAKDETSLVSPKGERRRASRNLAWTDSTSAIDGTLSESYFSSLPSNRTLTRREWEGAAEFQTRTLDPLADSALEWPGTALPVGANEDSETSEASPPEEAQGLASLGRPKADPASDRARLLARKYVHGQLSHEERARLEILTEKIRLSIPRVTVEDFEHVNDVIAKMQALKAENEERRRRLGL